MSHPIPSRQQPLKQACWEGQCTPRRRGAVYWGVRGVGGVGEHRPTGLGLVSAHRRSWVRPSSRASFLGVFQIKDGLLRVPGKKRWRLGRALLRALSWTLLPQDTSPSVVRTVQGLPFYRPKFKSQLTSWVIWGKSLNPTLFIFPVNLIA